MAKRFYKAGTDGGLILADHVELPSEDSAVHTAKLGSMKHAGSAAIAASPDDAGESVVPRTCGGMSGSAGGRTVHGR